MMILRMEMTSGEAWEGDRKTGDNTHRGGLVNVPEFRRPGRGAGHLPVSPETQWCPYSAVSPTLPLKTR
jgi:hypothetical protein